jgi:hypothetical protein
MGGMVLSLTSGDFAARRSRPDLGNFTSLKMWARAPTLKIAANHAG